MSKQKSSVTSTDRQRVHIPDITVIEPKQVWLIDVAIPGDTQMEDKTLEKFTKYQAKTWE